jgi:hypothetical protein
MTNRIRGAVPVALVVCALVAPAASAAPVTVNLRVEGVTSTIFEGPVTTDAHLVATPTDGQPRVCDGTSVGSPSGPTATGALDDAARLAGFTWDGTWDSGFNDYFPYSRIGPDTVDPATHFWSLWLNWNFAQAGGCGQRVNQGDEVLWAYEDFTQSPLLRLSGPGTALTGQPFTVRVVDGFDGSVEPGATVGGATTDAAGNASVTFTDAGVYRLKAQRPDAIRSNALVVCVDPPEALACSSTDKAAPSVRVSLPGDEIASERGRSRTVLVTWQADDGAGAGVSHYAVDVRQAANGLRRSQATPGGWRSIVGRTALTGVHFRGKSGRAYQFRITAVDRALNRSSVETPPLVIPVDDRDRGAWRFSRGWKRKRSSTAWGGTVIRAAKPGSTARLRFDGRSVSLVGSKLRKGGRLRVTLDGRSRVLRLRGATVPRATLWTSRRLRPGRHMLRIRALRGGPVQLDAVAPRP